MTGFILVTNTSVSSSKQWHDFHTKSYHRRHRVFRARWDRVFSCDAVVSFSAFHCVRGTHTFSLCDKSNYGKKLWLWKWGLEVLFMTLHRPYSSRQKSDCNPRSNFQSKAYRKEWKEVQHVSKASFTLLPLPVHSVCSPLRSTECPLSPSLCTPMFSQSFSSPSAQA